MEVEASIVELDAAGAGAGSDFDRAQPVAARAVKKSASAVARQVMRRTLAIVEAGFDDDFVV